MMIAAVTRGGPGPRAQSRVAPGRCRAALWRFRSLNERALQRAIIATPIGQEVPVRLRRAGHEVTLPVTVAERSRDDHERENGPDTSGRR
jgi:S1-C subfamily serine protease